MINSKSSWNIVTVWKVHSNLLLTSWHESPTHWSGAVDLTLIPKN